MPGALGGYNNVEMGSSIIGMANGNDGMTVAYIERSYLNPADAAVVSADAPTSTTVGLAANPQAEWANWALPGAAGGYTNSLYYSTNTGISATVTRSLAIIRAQNFPGGANAYQVAIAPDDAKTMVVTTDRGSNGGAADHDAHGPTLIWYTTDGGNNWELAFDGLIGGSTLSGESIRCIDISADYGGKRDIAFGTVNIAGNRPLVLQVIQRFQQLEPAVKTRWVTGVNVYAMKFSPTYSGDSSVALVYADGATGTFYNVALRDLNMNNTTAYVFISNGIMLWNAADSTKASPMIGKLNGACLQLPSDFSGQSASLRRAYVSLDVAHTALNDATASGIYRIDDTTVYVLMDTSTTMTNATTGKAIYSIAYFGTYASGKLLAGERYGFPCSATVPTWFTDSPTTCPIPCWYPALKPTTGAANDACSMTQIGSGGALVSWNADGSLGYVSTGSQLVLSALTNPVWYNQLATQASVANDESAFAISRNNGETWNQIVLINTTVDWFNDVAIAPDCTTIYLASSNTESNFCTIRAQQLPLLLMTDLTASGAPPSIPMWQLPCPRYRRWAPTGSASTAARPLILALWPRPTCPSCASSNPAPTRKTARS